MLLLEKDRDAWRLERASGGDSRRLRPADGRGGKGGGDRGDRERMPLILEDLAFFIL